MDRGDVSFTSEGELCAAWLYRSDDSTRPRPLIVMGHGLGGNREMQLDAYAQRFAAAGMHVLAFDYRHFGASDGQLVDLGKQRADWAAAVRYARTLPGVDSTRIALWGTALGGGHALAVAADDPYLAAVVVQCPFTSGLRAALAKGPSSVLKVGMVASLDALLAPMRRKPIGVALAGERGKCAMVSAADAPAGYQRMATASMLFDTVVSARSGFGLLFDAPARKVRQLKMPVFYAICEHDTVHPAGPARAAAAHTRNATVRQYPVGHFDIYYGETFETAVADQLEFLVSVLRP